MMKNSTQLKEGLTKKRWWFLVLIIVIAAGGIYFLSRPEVMKVETPKGEGLVYKVVSESSDSCWIVIETTYMPSETELKTTAYKAWEIKKTENIFLYLPEMGTSGSAYGVAKFIPQGLKEFKTNPSSLKGTKWEQKQ